MNLVYLTVQRVMCNYRSIITSSELHFIRRKCHETKVWKLGVVRGNVKQNKAQHS